MSYALPVHNLSRARDLVLAIRPVPELSVLRQTVPRLWSKRRELATARRTEPFATKSSLGSTHRAPLDAFQV